jgi:hypothetical protein
MEDFDPARYERGVARVLKMDGDGRRLMPLSSGECSCLAARQILKTSESEQLFPGAKEPESAMAGLWLYFSCFEEAHELVSNCKSPEAHLWHAILHRQEPDPGNAAYWFRKVSDHPVYPKLAAAAAEILKHRPDAEFRTSRREWDPYAFVAFCDRARMQPGSTQDLAAREIQRAEWQLLFDYTARPR